MLSSFISKLLLLRQFSLLEGEFKIFGKNFYTQPLQQMIFLQKKIEEKFGKEGLKLIYEASKESFSELIKDMSKFADDKEKFFKVLLDLIKHFGFGDIEIVEINEKELKAIAQVKNNQFAKEYVKLFGFQNRSVDYVLAGMIAGFFCKFFDKNIDCKEEECIAKKSLICKFIVKRLK